VADVVSTPRLDLVALEPHVLELIERDDAAAVERELSARVPAGWTQTIPARLRLEQLARDPFEQPWLVRAIVVQRKPACGRQRRLPRPSRPAWTRGMEFGYDVVPAQRRRGYARESVLGLTAWAYATGRARTCVLSITPDNLPSLSLGFRHVGKHIDDIDGRELVFELALPLAATR
jgi:[ribosomal protein S5]-alanine N-acetyltransferase